MHNSPTDSDIRNIKQNVPMPMKTLKMLFAVTLIGLICSCNHPQQIDIQEQIKTDYDHIQSQITEIESELLNDTMDMDSPRYKELIRMDDSLQTVIFTMYDYEELKTFFENNVKEGMNKYQYQNLMLELEEYKEK